MTEKRKRSAVRRWIRWAFLFWAVVSTAWLANSFRTRGVGDDKLQSSATVSVVDGKACLEFSPMSPGTASALIFFCGSGVSARAYAPLVRPIAEAGYPVFVVKLPYRFAPLESNKRAAVDRALHVIAQHPRIPAWVVSGHSLGGALACRLVQTDPDAVSAMVLVGTTHPKDEDLSRLRLPVTKVYASNDGIAPPERVRANQALLPAHTKWVEIEGGNHSQFGYYGHQLLDGTATASREAQQEITRSALLAALAEAGGFGVLNP